MLSEIVSGELTEIQRDRELLEKLIPLRSARSFRLAYRLVSTGKSCMTLDFEESAKRLKRLEAKVRRRASEAEAGSAFEVDLLELIEVNKKMAPLGSFYAARSALLRAMWLSGLYQKGRGEVAPKPPPSTFSSVNAHRKLDPLPRATRAAPQGYKIVVYTCVTNGWDELEDPIDPIPGADYVVFSDTAFEGLSIWQQVPINYSHADPTKVARFYKTHSRWFFPEHRFAIWADANIQIPATIIDSLEYMRTHEIPIAAISHPLRQCLYEEAHTCIARAKDEESVLRGQVEFYRDLGVPEQLGLYETGVMAFSHFDEKSSACCEMWWRDIERYSRRDQVSLPVALSKSQVRIHELLRVGETSRTGNGFSLGKHAERSKAQVFQQDRLGFLSVEEVAVKSDVIVPIFNNPEMSIGCIDRLRSYPNLGKLLLIDDFSAPENRKKIVDYAQQNDLELVLNEQNLGYTQSVHRMFAEVTAPSVFLVNTDTLPDHQAMDQCNSVLFSRAEMGAVGPLSNAASFQSIPHLRNEAGRFATNHDLLNVDASEIRQLLLEFFGSQDYLFTPLLNGFFYCIKKKALDTVGGFDVDNFRVFGEENDFIFRLQDAGYKTAIACKAYIPHDKAAGYRSVDYDVTQAKKKAGKNLREKWGDRVNASEEALKVDHGLTALRTFLASRLEVSP